MSQAEISRKIQTMFFENAEAAQIPPIINEQFESGDSHSVITMLNCILDARLERYQLETVISTLEDQFLINNLDFLCKYLFILYDRNGNEDMARFYLDFCGSMQHIPELQDEEEYNQRSKKYTIPETTYFNSPYYQNNFERSYAFNGEDKAYSVHSFSDEIGQNLTLLKTPYGDIIFDCGAKCNKNEAQAIDTVDFLNFLLASASSVDNIKAVIISHAHMDHYGSLATLINSGISPRIVFVGEETRKLIAVAARNMFSLESTRPLSAFFVANNKIKIEAFGNGHIVGSEGYIVSFDNINVVYTGDYCLHDQKTVKGLNPASISNNQFVKKYGVDCLITESTYGFTHRYLNHISAETVLRHFVSKLVKLGYKVLFPAFAIGRSQEIVLAINDRQSVLLDGLSVKISREYEHLTGVPIFNANTRYSTEADDKVKNLACNDVIVASSGMLAQSSTSSSYVEGLLSSGEKTAIIITGYMDSSEDSYGNALLERWKRKENVLLYVSLSAHASYEEIIELIETIDPRNIVAIHGNGIAHRESPMQVLESLEDTPVQPNKCAANIDLSETTLIEDNIQQVSIDPPPDNIHTSELPVEVIADNVDLVKGRIDSEVKDNVLTIESAQLQAKMVNVSKSGQSLVDNGADLSRSQPLVMACKLLLKFLKKEPRYKEISEYLDSLGDYNLFWKYIDECVKNGFSCPIYHKEIVLPDPPKTQEQIEGNCSKQIESRKDSIEIDGELPQGNQSVQDSMLKVKDPLKRKVNELAKDLNLRAKDIVAILEQHSIPVKNYMQKLTAEEINIVLEQLTHRMQVREDVIHDNQDADNLITVESISDDLAEQKRPSTLSDIMIVKCSDNDYYVSQKISGREVYLKLLEERSQTSNHYSSISIAKVVAEEMRHSILSKNPECEIKEYDIKDFASKEDKSIIRIVNDNYGKALFGVNEKGRKVFVYREGEEQFKFIDVLKYNKCMTEEYALYNSRTNFDYYNLGLCRGIDVAREAALPHLYYEIYKAEEMIKTFADDPELFECDIRFYRGYIDSLNKVIAIQKKCVVTPGNWCIHLLNLKGISLPQLSKFGTIDVLGSYTVVEFNPTSEFHFIPSERDIYIILAQRTENIAALVSKLGLTENIHYMIDTKHFLSKNINRVIEQLVLKHFRLGGVDMDLKIPESWVETIEQFADDEVDGDLADGSEAINPFGTADISKKNLKSYRFAISSMFSDYLSLSADDVSCLKGMCNRCIKHDQDDWKTTFEYLGHPELKTLRSFVSDAGLLRDSIRAGTFGDVIPFREKYSDMLLSMLRNADNLSAD